MVFSTIVRFLIVNRPINIYSPVKYVEDIAGIFIYKSIIYTTTLFLVKISSQ